MSYIELLPFSPHVEKDSNQTPAYVGNSAFLSPQSLDFNFNQYPDIYQNPWVYICIWKIATAVAGIPLKVFEKKTKDVKDPSPDLEEYDQEQVCKEIYGHRLTRLMKKINPCMSAFDFFCEIVSYLFLCGNVFIEVVRDGNGSPVELWPIDPRYIKIIPDKKSKISYYLFEAFGYRYNFSKKDIIHIKFFHPSNKFFGYPPLKSVIKRVMTEEKSQQFRDAYFENGASVGGILEVDQELTDTQYNLIEKRWKKSFTGPNRAHRLAILEAGLKFKNIEQTFDNLQFIPGKEFSAREIAAVFSMPPSLIGLDKDTPAKAKEVDLKLLYQETITPILKLIAGKFNEYFFSDTQYNNANYERFIAYDTSQVQALRDDIETVSRVVARVVDRGVMTINEVRGKFFNLPSVPWGDTFFMPLNTTVWRPDAQADRMGADQSVDTKKDFMTMDKFERILGHSLTSNKNSSNVLMSKLIC